MEDVKHDFEALFLPVVNHGHDKFMSLVQDGVGLQVLQSDSIALLMIFDNAFN